MKNKKSSKFRIVLPLLILCCNLVLISCYAQNHPNVIFILTDDQGYGDLACHGNPWIKTPNLDKLHSESVRFTNFHVGTTCSPSRAGLLSGMYNNKVGVWHTVSTREMVNRKEVLLPQIFKREGYKTAIFGKWHLGDNYPYRPQDRGFDEVLVHGGGGVGQGPDFWGNNYFDDTYFHNGVPKKFSGYCTDIWFENALKFIESNKDEPFFCYIATNAPHSPYIVAEEYSDIYKDHEKIPNANFYGMITNIDDNIGVLREKLEDFEIADNTILVFMTDNGTSAGVKFDENGQASKGFNAGMRGVKASPFEGGHRVPFFLHWEKGELNHGEDIEYLTSFTDFMPTILDLCNIEHQKVKAFDGISLKPYLEKSEKEYPDRTIFADTQRENKLRKWKDYCVMTQNYRLVNNQLFDINMDFGQENDISEKKPEVVMRLKKAYENWWSENTENNNYIPIGDKNQEKVHLYTMSALAEKGLPAWSQSDVLNGGGNNGVFPVDIVGPGKYNFVLRRWPKEIDLRINQGMLHNEDLVGKKFDAERAYVELDGEKVETSVEDGDYFVSLKLNIEKKKTFLKARFVLGDGSEKDAYYVQVSKVD
ncbi:arylsulfatase [Flagellimonas sp. 2504JD4-2]